MGVELTLTLFIVFKYCFLLRISLYISFIYYVHKYSQYCTYIFTENTMLIVEPYLSWSVTLPSNW